MKKKGYYPTVTPDDTKSEVRFINCTEDENPRVKRYLLLSELHGILFCISLLGHF